MRITAWTAGLLVLTAGAAWADDDCQLRPTAVVELGNGSGAVTLPVTLNGQNHNFVLGLESGLSEINTDAADTLGLRSGKLKDMYQSISVTGDKGGKARIAVAPSFAVAGLTAVNFELLESEQRTPPGPDSAIGMLGLGALETRDIELDLADHRMNLFDQHHCSGHVVYWSDTAVRLPMLVEDSGNVRVYMELDGKKVLVALSTDRTQSVIGMNAMRRIFGVDAASPGMTPAPERPGFYRYSFSGLNAGGLNIAHPDILVEMEDPHAPCQARSDFRIGAPDMPGWIGPPQEQQSYCYGLADLHLGTAVLRRLRLFFAFREKALYLTPATARTTPQ
jgi:hypothetical protein